MSTAAIIEEGLVLVEKVGRMERCLLLIENLTASLMSPNDEDRDVANKYINKIFIYAHIGLGRDLENHKDWVKEVDVDYINDIR